MSTVKQEINFPRPYGRGFYRFNFVALHLEEKEKMQGELHPSTLRSGIYVWELKAFSEFIKMS